MLVQARGCTILVKNTIPSKKIPRPSSCGEGVEVLAVSVQLRETHLQIYNIYSSPDCATLDASEVLSLCATSPTFLGGDFNAHHEAIGSTKPRNQNGHHIAKVMTNVPEAALLNTGEATHMAGGVLDLFFTSKITSQNATWNIIPFC
ncbi:hypothetical protein E2C01_024974 [Portunus trituberculatus]|uniref:Endonuclease/exonuclease/phosphatase domain-containing protein n=1 Tax=Portunus trituberculatus TaxID=210409 RepID=A0A5B7EDV6_PORTR|nr:hypothetical protein [Portunus trituberculatus]